LVVIVINGLIARGIKREPGLYVQRSYRTAQPLGFVVLLNNVFVLRIGVKRCKMLEQFLTAASRGLAYRLAC
jgi:hypothetical protein